MIRVSDNSSQNMRRVHNLCALLLLLFATSSRAEWEIVSSVQRDSGPAGVTHVETVANESSSGSRTTLHFAVFPMKTATLRVVDSGGGEARAPLADTMQRENAIAGVNGGYFHPDYGVVGLLVTGGRVVAPQQKARLLSGVVSAAKDRVQVQRAAEFSLKNKPPEARQAGPFLVEGGKAVPGLNDTRAARRTFVLVSGDRAAVGYSSGVTLAQLANVLATSGAAGELKVTRALNLDGGSSSGFWFNGSNGPFSISERKTVRDYLAVVPRE
jgi:hypothetical protein